MKKGFTLAEVVIAMAMLGVLAGILIPILNFAKPNKEKMMFKKALKVTQEVISDILNDNRAYPDEERGFRNTNGVTIGGTTYSGNSKFRNLFKEKLDIIEDNGQNFTTSDGIEWTVPNDNFSDEEIIIEIDTNNDEKPNCKYNINTCKKPDQFKIFVGFDGRVWIDEDDDVAQGYIKATNKTGDRNE